METTGTVERKNDRGSILVSGEWYSSYKGKHTGSINPGDIVKITWKPSDDGKWKNISFLDKTGTGAVTPAAAGGGGGWSPRNNVGVELGHASKLGLDIAFRVMDASEEIAAGSEAFYKLWLEHTDKVYKVMHKLRTMKEKELAAPAPVIPKGDPLVASDEPF